ncbi:RRN11 [[Candida] subhashii]|uniref:RRN11 n=1 Tax=[Candida] subhashii TaxID=561895 RepID=A0A8J5QGW0_9ASCO|nr:RRN11 [[Candida] subhashii]KAG7661001.1 RRN11 [[Candida] subhashii]
MFEDITYRNSGHETKLRSTEQLISKYIELKKFQEIYQHSSRIHKKKLRKSKAKKKVLELIHTELQNRRTTKPEETYEVWHNDENGGSLNQNLKAKSRGNNTSKKNKKNRKEAVTGITAVNAPLATKVYEYLENIDKTSHLEQEAYNEKYEEYDTIMTNKLHQFTQTFDKTNRSVKADFLIRTNGLEVLPVEYLDKSNSIQQQHIKNLSTLLHLNILRKNWELGYKLFCLLIRFPSVDIRTIWPLGIEILTHLQQPHPQHSNLKVEKFFEYLISFYTITNVNSTNTSQRSRSNTAPVWRSGSKTLTPLYVITALWNLFIKQDYETVMNRIQEFILEPPYNTEGVLYFMLVLCNLSQATKVVNGYIVQDDLDKLEMLGQPYRTKSEVVERLDRIKETIEGESDKCREFSFVFDSKDIEISMERLYERIEKVDERERIGNGVSNGWDEISSDEDVVMSEGLSVQSSRSDIVQQNGKMDLEKDQLPGNDSDHEANGWSDISSDSISDHSDTLSSTKLISPIPTQDEGWSDISSDKDDGSDNEDIENATVENNTEGGWSEISSDEEEAEPDKHQPETIDLDETSFPETSQKWEPNIERGDEDEEDEFEDSNPKFDAFDMRRNSLELYDTRGSSLEAPHNNNGSGPQGNIGGSQQTMIDFDFDFD